MRILCNLIFLLIFVSCGNKNFISNKNHRNRVSSDFDKAKTLAANRSDQLFNVIDNTLTKEEEGALKFLYAYMPLNDLADYGGDFFLKNVRLAFEAREAFPWGKDIPEDIFRYFVLPHRVNNENLDSSRIVFYKDLKERLEGLSLREAALEVNYWCQEKVIYQPTSRRTISPLGAIRSAYGRCGEESTFTVTALRAACIPARQCYTPRWAHVDDNHAWVEVWIDGKWYYMGACEPEPKLNVGWFTAAAYRTMLVNSKVFGQYYGNDVVDVQKDRYAYLNMLGNYADTRVLNVSVYDEDAKPVEGAKVQFQLYNYAEFYTLSEQATGKNGVCSFTTGNGDLLIWVSKDGKFAYKKITVAVQDTVKITLGDNSRELPYETEFIVTPPPPRTPPTIVSEDEAEANKRRIEKGNEIREAYIASFPTETVAKKFASELGLDEDKVWDYVKRSRGNYPAIMAYLDSAVNICKDYVLEQLEVVSPKDLRDLEPGILLNNLRLSKPFIGTYGQELFLNYILRPRVGHEKLSDSRMFLYKSFNSIGIRTTQDLEEWIAQNLLIDEEANYYEIPITPRGVFELRAGDKFSRDIFFVIGCRVLGIPARLEEGANVPQYYVNGLWKDAAFVSKQDEARPKGKLLIAVPPDVKIDPAYYLQFTIAKIEDGEHRTLEYDWERKLSRMDNPLSLETGGYILTMGNRGQDGSVAVVQNFFSVEKDKTATVVFRYPKAPFGDSVIGFSSDMGFSDEAGNSLTVDKDKVNVIAWIDMLSEPSKHVLNDIQALEKELSSSGLQFWFIVPSGSLETLQTTYKLPKNSKYVFDKDDIRQKVIDTTKEQDRMPLVILSKGDWIYYHLSGYTIGVGEQLIKIKEKLSR